MNIEYTDEQLEQVKAKQGEIHKATIEARNASDRVLKLIGELNALHTQVAIEYFKGLEKAKPWPDRVKGGA